MTLISDSNNRSSKIVVIGRLIQKFPLKIFRLLEWPLVRFFSERGSTPPKIIILLAVPRSGSTLTYQLLCHSLKPVYLSNFGNLFFQLPFFAGLVSLLRRRRFHSDFVSKGGFVAGLHGPAEGKAFWQYWFNNGLDDRSRKKGSVQKNRQRSLYLRSVFGALSRPGAPVVTGYLGHILEIPRLVELFPEAVFVRLHRDPISNAMSILKSRREAGTRWFSLFPRECLASQDLSEHEQVAAQVYWLRRRMNALSAEHMIDIDYEELCKSPSSVMSRVVEYVNLHGFDVSTDFDLPYSFSRKQPIPSDPDGEKLVKAMTRLKNKHGGFNE